MKKANIVAAGLVLALAGCGGGHGVGGPGGGGPGGGGGGGLIAFRSSTVSGGDIFTVLPAGGATTNVTNSAFEEESPAISPDGTRIAYYRRAGLDPLTSELWVSDADGTNARKLADGASSFEPDWSPDGTKIAFYGRGNSLQVIHADGTSLQTLVAALPQNGEVTWTSDGTQLVFDGVNAGLQRNIEIIGSSGAGRHILVNNAKSPDISPDGTKIVFTRNNGTFIQSSDATGVATSVIADGTDADFSPDGTEIVYVAHRGGGPGPEGANLFRIPVAGGAESQITTSGDALQPAWS